MINEPKLEMTLGEAHAKIILLGEHFVLSGNSALALPLPELVTRVKIQPSSLTDYRIDSPYEENLGSSVYPLMREACIFLARRLEWDLESHPLTFSSSSNFPISRGLGSSASFSVALARAFTQLKARSYNLHPIAQEIENLFHIKSSGLDTSTALSSVPILFKEGKVIGQFIQTAVDLVVIDGSPRENCSHYVERTLNFRMNHSHRWSQLAEQVERWVNSCFRAINQSDGAPVVFDAINSLQAILDEIGLVTPQMTVLLELGKQLGAAAGKMTGAGGGGAMLFATLPGHGAELAERLKRNSVQVLTLARAF